MKTEDILHNLAGSGEVDNLRARGIVEESVTLPSVLPDEQTYGQVDKPSVEKTVKSSDCGEEEK